MRGFRGGVWRASVEDMRSMEKRFSIRKGRREMATKRTKKTVKTKKKNPMSSARREAMSVARQSQGKRMGDEMLETLVQAVVTAYPNDASTPGVLVSLLTSGDWYVAVLRYREKFGGGKYNVCSAKAKGAGDAIEQLAKDWYARHTAKCDLGSMIGVAMDPDWDDHRWGRD